MLWREFGESPLAPPNPNTSCGSSDWGSPQGCLNREIGSGSCRVFFAAGISRRDSVSSQGSSPNGSRYSGFVSVVIQSVGHNTQGNDSSSWGQRIRAGCDLGTDLAILPADRFGFVTQLSQTLNQDIKVISLVCFPHMMSHAYWLVIPPMYPILIEAFGLAGPFAYTQVAFLTTVFAASTFILQTPVGFVVDRIGARAVLIGGLSLEAVAIGLFSVATEYWQLVVLASIAGMGHTVFHPADYAILSSRVSEKRIGRAFSIHSATGYVGFALAPIFMTGVAALWHWRGSFFLIGLIGLMAVLALAQQADVLRDDALEKQDNSGPRQRLSTGDGLRLILSVPVLMCFLYFIFHQMGSGGLRSFLVAALGDLYGTPALAAATALSAFTVGAVAGILSGGFVADRFGPRITTACLTLGPAAVAISVLGWFDVGIVGVTAVLAVSGFLIGLLIPSRDLLLRSVTPPGSMGTVMGFASTGANLGGALIPLILGYAMDTGGGSWVFWASALFVALACVTFVTVRGGLRGSAVQAN